MFSPRRDAYDRAYSDDLARRYQRALEAMAGPIPFRLAETPLFVDDALRKDLAEAAEAIVGQLAEPATLATLKRAIPKDVDAPGMDALPDCVQVDFALCRDAHGRVHGKVVELQAFPSLYALETLMADAWVETLDGLPGFEDARAKLGCFVETSRAESVAWMKQVVVGDADPFETVLVDYRPEAQKTLPDFVATHRLFGVSPVCVTKLVRRGRSLFRESGGRLVPVKRIYNRLVFDELEAKKVELPFRFTDDLDVTWCSHPNWYWTWSKYSLPYLNHPSVPRSRFLADVYASGEVPDDLSAYVLKPLFSFAGSGVVIDPTRAILDAVPEERRASYVLQEKVVYDPLLRMAPQADGFDPAAPGVKAEIRVMVLKHPGGGPRPLRPLLFLVRTSRGRMLGVDQNQSAQQAWSGGTVALFG